ncbi:MAG: MBL fold metallo-hydrolase [Elusimicrobia bacterium]|nr:MBL fold metallo-hydrolase [Elusimicrobiota bacterium]
MPKEPALIVRQLELGPMANFVYLVADPDSKECAVVDPAWDVPAVLDAVAKEGWRLSRAIVTHRHGDHMNGVAALLKAADVPVHIHKSDAHALAGVGAARPTSGGDVIEIGKARVTLLHTPGHTEGSQCLLFPGGLVSGDTLFIGSCGRVDFEDSDPEKMYRSLRRLGELADDTVLYPGHHYAPELSVPLGRQKSANPYLKTSLGGALPDFLALVGA